MDFYLGKWKTPQPHPFLFTTGIEGSYPVITDRDGRDKRIDLFERTGFYEQWRHDFQLVKALGIQFLRYGPPYYRVHVGPGKYDWSFSDDTLAELERLKITVLVDLCHFGVPDWLGNFQNEEWPHHFAEYARAFATRYPHLRLFTPVNEIFITAKFSAHLGWWNERQQSDFTFIRAIINCVKANLLAQEAIIEVQPLALFIQVASTEYFHPEEPAAVHRADFLNSQRFLPLDLCYGQDVAACTYAWLLDNGVTHDEYMWLRNHGSSSKLRCIMGNDYYATNEHVVPVDERKPVYSAGETYGYYIVTRGYYDRYHLPVMHTETNIKDADLAPQWLHRQWHQLLQLKRDGVPIVGFTWYSLIDQIDWDVQLREDNGTVNPCGLFDLNRQIRPVGLSYQQLIARWKDILPMESRSIDLLAYSTTLT